MNDKDVNIYKEKYHDNQVNYTAQSIHKNYRMCDHEIQEHITNLGESPIYTFIPGTLAHTVSTGTISQVLPQLL